MWTKLELKTLFIDIASMLSKREEGLLSQKLQMWTKLELKTLLIDIASIFSKLEPETVSFHRQCTCQNNVVVVNSSSEIFFIDIAAVAKTCSEKPSIDVKCKLSKH